ncbi:hypothetical protein SteCoe_21767 [Stentor coeruleus]|uniref:Dickkopf N-terminal cysteine-rich domain-containing protein n=1 Tax=Stentor coeruleus TaxID=5963 RepID=A0A1R2BP10_9CILI|nr:hypothetical protein SteCoe_21767 [Stentor coeruleus]
MNLILSALLSISQSLDISNCAAFSCALIATATTCASYSQNVLTLTSCVDGYTCSGLDSMLSEIKEYSSLTCIKENTDNTDSCYEYWGTGKNPSGWPCCEDSNCASQNCTDDYCKGKTINESCNSDEECEVGLYCDEKCIKLKTLNEDCISDSSCPIGSGCNKNICTELFSIGLGEESEDKKFCISNFIKSGLCDTLVVWNQTSVITPPYECKIGTKCKYVTYNSQEVFEEENCLCAGVTGESGYCPIVDGVSLADLTGRIGYTEGNCSGLLSHTDNVDYLYKCDSISDFDYQFYKQVTEQRKFWPLFQSKVLVGCGFDEDLFNPEDYGISAAWILFPFLMKFLIVV